MITFKLVLRFSTRKNLTFRWFSSMKSSTTSYALTVSSNSTTTSTILANGEVRREREGKEEERE